MANRNKAAIDTMHGIVYSLDLVNAMDSSIHCSGCFKPVTVALVDKSVKQGMTVLDIGANISCHKLRFTRQTILHESYHNKNGAGLETGATLATGVA